jgi:NF-X1-type zinc finger protein NFXL1
VQRFLSLCFLLKKKTNHNNDGIRRASKCHHEKIQTHRCHYDSCPPCKLTCGLKMNCGHACQATCHSAVLTEIVENKDREGPWVKLNIKHEYVKQPCRDCQVLLKVTCLGKHETSDLPCYRAKPYPCGRECGRLLNCTHHTCKLECHELPANVTEKSNTQTDLCESCERSCEQTRPPGCEHECSIGNCHEGPCPDCTKLLKLRCHCKTNLVYVECCKWNRADAQRKVQMQSCQVPCTKTISCGHQCTLNCHAGECTQAAQCTEKQVLKCACKTLRKSVICNQLEQEKGLKVKMEKGEKRFVLDCSEKCGEKKRKEEANAKGERTHEPEKTESCNNKPNLFSNNQRNVFIVLSVLVLMISFCVFYFYPFLVEND